MVFTGANSPTTVDRFPRGEAQHYRERTLGCDVGPALDAFIARLPAGAHILDAGPEGSLRGLLERHPALELVELKEVAPYGGQADGKAWLHATARTPAGAGRPTRRP